jgi:hypothetical protein
VYPRSPDPRGGHTLVELALAATILVVALGSLALFSRNSASALNSGASQAELEAELRRTLRRMSEELLPSGLSVIGPQPFPAEGSREVVYRRSEGQINGRIRWGAPRRLAFALEAGELDDGLDNNGNGLVDEGTVEWTLDLGMPGEHTVTLCHGVRALGRLEQDNGLDDDQDGRTDEPGLAFWIEDGTLRLSLTLERLDPQRLPVAQTLETVVRPRN